MTTRRRSTPCLLTLALLASHLIAASAQAIPSAPDRRSTEPADTLAALANRQRDTGSFAPTSDLRPLDDLPASALDSRRTALALLAFLSSGHPPAHGPFGDTVSRAELALVRTPPGNDPLTLLALVNLLAVERDPALRGPLRDTAQATLANVTSTKPDDLFSAAMLGLALTASREAGLTVAPEAFDRLNLYLASCRMPTGSYAATPNNLPQQTSSEPTTTPSNTTQPGTAPSAPPEARGISTRPATAAALVLLRALGEAGTPEAEIAAARLALETDDDTKAPEPTFLLALARHFAPTTAPAATEATTDAAPVAAPAAPASDLRAADMPTDALALDLLLRSLSNSPIPVFQR